MHTYIQGFTVYVTGRTHKDLQATADHVTSAGGRGIAIVCDHSDDRQIKALFDRIHKVSFKCIFCAFET